MGSGRGVLVDRRLEEPLVEQIRLRLLKQKEDASRVRPLLDACQKSFLAFLPYWHFQNRETGEVSTFGSCPIHTGEDEHPGTIWQGQLDFAEMMMKVRWIFALKAGKLGFTEIECAFDGWKVMFHGENTRVHIFSRDATSAEEILALVRFGLLKLPDWMRYPIAEEERGGDTGRSIKLYAGGGDIRQVVRYAAAPSVSIDQSCQHAHVDELSHMPFAEKTWGAVSSTVAPEGSCHVVTRGSGNDVFTAPLWRAAKQGNSKLKPFFVPWNGRPDRDQKWYELESGSMTPQQLHHFAPETEEDALRGEEADDFIPIEWWTRCQRELPPFVPGSDEPVVLGVDAAVTNDNAGIVALTRHPEIDTDVCIRAVKKWTPPVDLASLDGWIRVLAQGGCINGHPQYDPYQDPEDCEACREKILIKPYNIVQVAYDPYQLESIAQQQRRDGVTWWKPFGQQKDRLIADSMLRDLIMKRHIWHDGNQILAEHIMNAGAKIDGEDEHKIRIIKKSPEKKVDLVVALSMGVKRNLELSL